MGLCWLFFLAGDGVGMTHNKRAIGDPEDELPALVRSIQPRIPIGRGFLPLDHLQISPGEFQPCPGGRDGLGDLPLMPVVLGDFYPLARRELVPTQIADREPGAVGKPDLRSQ